MSRARHWLDDRRRRPASRPPPSHSQPAGGHSDSSPGAPPTYGHRPTQPTIPSGMSLRRTRQPPLVPRSGEGTVQDGRAHVQGHSWNRDVIPQSTGSCRRSAWSTFPPLCSDQSSAGAARETDYRRWPDAPSGTACRTM